MKHTDQYMMFNHGYLSSLIDNSLHEKGLALASYIDNNIVSLLIQIVNAT